MLFGENFSNNSMFSVFDKHEKIDRQFKLEIDKATKVFSYYFHKNT